MARRADHSREQLKALAIKTTQEFITEHGVAALSARKITGKMGYTIGTLYQVFADVDDLLLHVNAETLDGLRAHIETQRAASPQQGALRLRQLASLYVEYTNQHPQLWQALLHYRWAEDKQPPVWYQEKVSGLLGIVEKVLQEQVTTDVSRHARILWAGLQGISTLYSNRKFAVTGGGSLSDLVEAFVMTYVQGMRS